MCWKSIRGWSGYVSTNVWKQIDVYNWRGGKLFKNTKVVLSVYYRLVSFKITYMCSFLYILYRKIRLTTTIYSAKITMKVDLCSPQTAHTFCSGNHTRSAGQGIFFSPDPTFQPEIADISVWQNQRKRNKSGFCAA